MKSLSEQVVQRDLTLDHFGIHALGYALGGDEWETSRVVKTSNTSSLIAQFPSDEFGHSFE